MPTSPESNPKEVPTLPLMHGVFVLAGFGTMLLGPILPLLSQRWRLTDSQSGLLILAQFVGATLGGLTVTAKLGRDLLIGLAAAFAGFSVLAYAPGLPLACAGLAVGGFGVGRTIASVNIIAGARYTQNRGAALSRLNFTWSFGALLSPLTAAWLIRVPLATRLAAFAACFLIAAIVLAMQLFRDADEPAGAKGGPEVAKPLPLLFFIYFIALLFIYGGLETCLSAWLTTYALRYGTHSLLLSEYTMVLLLCGLTAGRALAAWLLLRLRDTTLQRIALALSAALAGALALAHQAAWIAALAVLLGVALAPVFPATFAILMARKPSANQAGIVIAASGLGAAALPALMGWISTHAGSLQMALTVPVAAALVLLAMTLSARQKPTTHGPV
jgi:MFS transporter, FHS family, glucose/mannose:H+ symporter